MCLKVLNSCHGDVYDVSYSDVTVVTRYTSQLVGSRLTYDTRGILQHREACAREVTYFLFCYYGDGCCVL